MNSSAVDTIKRRCLPIAALAIAISALPRYGVAAAQPLGFIAINASTFQTTESLNSKGQKVPGYCDFIQQTESIYVSYQARPRDWIYGDTAFDVDTCGNTSTRGLTDIEIGDQHGISGKAHPQQWSIKGSLIMPTGYSIEANPRLGYDRPGATLGMNYLGGWQAGAHHFGFVAASFGMKAYTTYPAPQLTTSLSAGLGVTPGALVMMSYFGGTALGHGGEITGIGQNPILGSGFDSYQFTESVTFSLAPNLGLNLSNWNLIGGSNVGIGSTQSAGLWIRF